MTVPPTVTEEKMVEVLTGVTTVDSGRVMVVYVGPAAPVSVGQMVAVTVTTTTTTLVGVGRTRVTRVTPFSVTVAKTVEVPTGATLVVALSVTVE